MVTQKKIYNLQRNGTSWKVNRAIEVQNVAACTISQPHFSDKSDEFVIHVDREWDYRYIAPSYKNSIVNTIRQVVNR